MSMPLPRNPQDVARLPSARTGERLVSGGRLLRVAGIDLEIHWTFVLFLAWIFASYLLAGGGARRALVGTLFVVAVFACVVLHELGHALVARGFGIRTRSITLYPIGGVSRLERIPDKPSEELWVALAGPAVNLMVASGIGIVVVSSLVPSPWYGITGGLVRGGFLERLVFVNLALALFNLLPAFPMDGGRVLRALLAMKLDYVRATQYAATAGQVLAVGLGLLGLLTNWFLLFIALFVFVGAQQEAHFVQTRALLAGVPVHAAMITRFTVLLPNAPLSQAASELIASEQKDFPVVEDGRVLGVLTRDDLLRALAEGRQNAPVSQAMVSDCGVVDPGDKLDVALAKMQSAHCNTVLVAREGALVGILTTENIGEWMMLHRAGAESRAYLSETPAWHSRPPAQKS